MFQSSMFVPAAFGLFGLGTTYLVWGPQELFGYPARDERVDRSMGMWGILMGGLCQLLTGLIIFVGLSWFDVFGDEKVLYMAALAFSVFGAHWFVLGWNRYRGNSARPNAGMAVAFTIVSVLGSFVFFDAGNWALGVLFIGLALVYVSEFFASFEIAVAERVLGLVHILTGLWLMYLVFATVLNLTSGYTLPSA